MSVKRTLDKAIKCMDAGLYSRYANALRDEDYKTASMLFRQAEQDDLTDAEVEKLLKLFVNKFGKRPA